MLIVNFYVVSNILDPPNDAEFYYNLLLSRFKFVTEVLNK